MICKAQSNATYTLAGILLLKNGSRPIYFNHSSVEAAIINDVSLEGLSLGFKKLIRADDFKSQERV
jgi:hypothetical protein